MTIRDVINIIDPYDKDKIHLKMINRDANPDIESSCAHICFRDLIAVPRYTLTTDDGQQGSILITHELQTHLFQMTDAEILAIARTNTLQQKFEIQDMRTVLAELLGQDAEHILADSEQSPQILIISNESKINGAVALLSRDTLDQVCEKLNESEFFVIPSSIHEVLAIANSEVVNPADLRDRCRAVNATMEERDRLGDNIYRYSGNTHRLAICNTQEERLMQEQSEQKAMLHKTNMHVGRRQTV